MRPKTVAEPAAVDRNPPQQCGACGAVAPILLERRPVADYLTWLCADPTACRLRALTAGIWCRYEPGRVR